MTNADRLHNLYAQIRDLAVIMDPTQAANFTANVRLMAGENLSPQAWVDGAKAAVSNIQRRLLEYDTGWETESSRGCYLRRSRTVKFHPHISIQVKKAFVAYERLIWDGQSFYQSASHDGDVLDMISAIDSGD